MNSLLSLFIAVKISPVGSSERKYSRSKKCNPAIIIVSAVQPQQGHIDGDDHLNDYDSDDDDDDDDDEGHDKDPNNDCEDADENYRRRNS